MTFQHGQRVTHNRLHNRGVGTVTGNPCHWPRCTNVDCVEVRWDDHFPTLGENHDASELEPCQ